CPCSPRSWTGPRPAHRPGSRSACPHRGYPPAAPTGWFPRWTGRCRRGRRSGPSPDGSRPKAGTRGSRWIDGHGSCHCLLKSSAARSPPVPEIGASAADSRQCPLNALAWRGPPPSESRMRIQPGDNLPDVPIKIIDGDIRPAQTGTVFADRNVVMFGVPGAFTPTCSNRHLPGYVARFDEFRTRGISVMCLAVNDAYVMQAWAVAQHVPSGLLMLADGNASFTRALGLELDGTEFGMGLRTRRFALYAEDGVVRQLHVEAPGELRVSTAEAMLGAIGR